MPDSQVLVDKIIKLQRLMAKKQEKMDFMEEHIGTLLEEVKKKGKIIQHYVMKMEPGALATAESDRNKVFSHIKTLDSSKYCEIHFCSFLSDYDTLIFVLLPFFDHFCSACDDWTCSRARRRGNTEDVF